MTVEVHTAAGKFVLEKIDKLPSGLGVQTTGKWDFLRQAIKGLKERDDKLKVNCPNKRQASLAQSAAKNHLKRSGRDQVIPNGCKLRTNTLPLKNGTVDVYVYFDAK